MTAARSFLLAIDLATRQRDQAAQGLMKAQSMNLFAQGQMSQLETYSLETELKWTTAAQIGTTPELMRHEYQFMNRLQQAIRLQRDVLEAEDRKVDAAKRLLLAAEFRLASLKQLVKQMQAKHAVLEARREQKQMDEFASLQFGRAKQAIAQENHNEH
jgi:flagellar FliJ protein